VHSGAELFSGLLWIKTFCNSESHYILVFWWKFSPSGKQLGSKWNAEERDSSGSKLFATMKFIMCLMGEEQCNPTKAFLYLNLT